MTKADEILWRSFSQVYDEVMNVLPYRNLLLEIVDAAEITNSMRLIDACCGTANLLWALGEQGVTCHVTGLDYSPDMLAKAEPKAKAYHGAVEFVTANLDEPVDTWKVSGVYDRFIFNNSLCLIEEPTAVLRKMATLAADGARLVASTPRPNPNITELLEEHLQLSEEAGVSREEALQRMMPQLQPLIKCNEQLMQRYGDSYHLPTEPLLRNWFKDTGWAVETITTTYAGQNWLVTARKA